MKFDRMRVFSNSIPSISTVPLGDVPFRGFVEFHNDGVNVEVEISSAVCKEIVELVKADANAKLDAIGKDMQHVD